MLKWLNVGHVQFDLNFQGFPQQVIGKMIYADTVGCTILKENDGTEHSYVWGVVEHITLAP